MIHVIVSCVYLGILEKFYVEPLFAEILRAQRIKHIEALQMPDGLGKKPIDYASSIYVIGAISWATSSKIHLTSVKSRNSSLQSLAYMQLSTLDMTYFRKIGLSIN